ncbi:MAG TPA: S8 family serine peptidase, partial [Bryobacteraceae bacterium]|nr:S8 family serine peptidase [Bryobacteraceae bacterium]
MKIAIIDSGIHPDHPHVEGVAGGVGVTPQGLAQDFIDRLGHGTAVAAAIREKAGRHAELYAVKVFDRRLTANIDVILRALQWCSDQRMDLINLSLGTSNPAHRAKFEQVLTNGPLVVGAAHSLPGDLPGVIGVAPDPECPRDSFRYREGVFYASPFPRPIP